MPADYWILAIITAGSALTSLGFSIEAVSRSSEHARTHALYATARSVAFTAIAVVPFFHHAKEWLIAAAVGMIAVQLLDGLIGLRERDNLKTYGPIMTGIANLIALLWFIA